MTPSVTATVSGTPTPTPTATASPTPTPSVGHFSGLSTNGDNADNGISNANGDSTGSAAGTNLDGAAGNENNAAGASGGESSAVDTTSTVLIIGAAAVAMVATVAIAMFIVIRQRTARASLAATAILEASVIRPKTPTARQDRFMFRPLQAGGMEVDAGVVVPRLMEDEAGLEC
jgi:hypothetical protein